MSTAKTHYSCAELAAFNLPGLPGSEKRMRDRVVADGWASRQVACKGGKGGIRREYQPPAAIARLIAARQAEILITSSGAGSSLPAPSLPGGQVPAGSSYSSLPAPIDPATLTEAQRTGEHARAMVLRELDRIMSAVGCTQETALTTLLTNAALGRIDPPLLAMLKSAKTGRGRQSANGLPSARTLKRWLSVQRAGVSLAPRKREKDMTVKPWYALAMELRTRPQGSHITWIAEQIVEQWNPAWGTTPPSYDVVARLFRDKISQIDQLKGRYTGSQLRSKRFYQHRTATGLAPADEVHADGWNTHFTAPHPKTGDFVTYEVWHFHDVATRYVTPPGLSLTENFEVIAKGLENFIRVFGVPLIVQTDSTKIVRGNDAFTKALHSFEERLGITITHPKEVGNSQANGICENYNISYLDKRSRELATCQNKSMDSLTFKRVGKITAKMVKAQKAGDLEAAEKFKQEAQRAGKGRVFESHAQAVEWINRIVDEYNDKPHRALPKVACPATGKKRHQTPREALNQHIANGWKPTLMGDTQEAHEIHLVAAFRRRKECKVTRETVSPYGGNRYANADILPHWNGKSVWVAYDMDDASQVWIFGNQGELICRAELVEATGYRAQTAYEAAEEKRAMAQIRHRQLQIEKIRAQRMPDTAIEGEFERVKTIADFIDINAVPVKAEPEKTLADFLPDEKKKEESMSYADTVMWLYGDKEVAQEEGAAAR